ncbi:MAG TPA: VanZ family protein, partial [Microbacterium sp.]|nr:VanZ family protein [Microbacterium sp.]
MVSAVNEEPSEPGARALLVVPFVAYLVLLVWIVLWKLEIPWIGEAALIPRPIKLVPFLPSADADASAPIEVVINLLLFVPFGLYLGLLAP